MMTMYMRPIVALLAGLIAATSMGADKEVESLLAKMRQVYSSTNTARIVIKTTGPRFGKNTINTDLTYSKDRKIYAKVSGFESLKGRTRTFICDGKKISVDDLVGNIQVGEFDPDIIPIPINLEAMSFWDWKRQLSTGPGSNMEKSTFKLRKNVRWNNRDWLVLEEKAAGQDVYVDYFIDPKTSLIHRVQVYDLLKRNLATETVVTKIERNIKVDQKLFRVKGKTIVDTAVKVSGKRID